PCRQCEPGRWRRRGDLRHQGRLAGLETCGAQPALDPTGGRNHAIAGVAAPTRAPREDLDLDPISDCRERARSVLVSERHAIGPVLPARHDPVHYQVEVTRYDLDGTLPPGTGACQINEGLSLAPAPGEVAAHGLAREGAGRHRLQLRTVVELLGVLQERGEELALVGSGAQ